MAKFPAMPLWTDAIIADCQHLTNEEFGLYMRLLMLIWRTPGCRIPNDPNWIFRRLNTPFDAVAPLIKEFCQTSGNFITQKRLRQEMEYLTAKAKNQSDKAKLRWVKEKDACNGNADTPPPGNAPTPTPTPTPFSKEVDGLEGFSEREFSQFRNQCPSLTEKEFQQQLFNCGQWIKIHGAKTPELTLSKWLQKAENDKPQKKQSRDHKEAAALMDELRGLKNEPV